MKLPFTLRLAYYAFRATLRAGLLFLCAWLVFIPANAEEQEALGAGPAAPFPPGLRPMRMARAMVTLAPEPASRLLSIASGGEISPLLARLVLNEMANGRLVTTPRTPPAGGSKFIKVE